MGFEEFTLQNFDLSSFVSWMPDGESLNGSLSPQSAQVISINTSWLKTKKLSISPFTA